MYKLTIGIPTFNRNRILVKTVSRIAEQLEDNVELLIIDNNSDIPANDSLRELDKKNIRIIRNNSNIGGNANILRCTEEASGEYVWVLGDDDLPISHAVKYILELLESNKDVLWINFKSNDLINQPSRIEDKKCHSLKSFLESFSSISELVFISNNVIKTEFAKKGMHYGFEHIEKNFPIGVSVIRALSKWDENGLYLIQNKDLFESIGNINEERIVLPNWLIYIGIIRLIQVPFSKEIDSQILRLVRGARKAWISNKFLFSGLSYYIKKNGRRRTFLHTGEIIGLIILLDKFKSPVTIFLLFLTFLMGGNYVYIIDKISKNSKLRT